MSTKNLMRLLIAFCNREDPYGLAKCNMGIVSKVKIEIKRGLFGSDIQTLEFSEQGAGVYSQLFGRSRPIAIITAKRSFYHECFHLP